MRYTRLPTTIDAVQFTGENWAEMHAFTGHRKLEGQTESDGREAYADIFNPIGTYLYKDLNLQAEGELWVEANQSWLPIIKGEWVLKDSIGFYPCANTQFVKTYVEESEAALMYSGMTDESIPTLLPGAEDARMLGRVRMALIMTRPLSEADLICDRLLTWAAQYRINYLGDNLTHDDQTMFKVRAALEKGLKGWGIVLNPQLITELISEMQNARILFRETP